MPLSRLFLMKCLLSRFVPSVFLNEGGVSSVSGSCWPFHLDLTSCLADGFVCVSVCCIECWELVSFVLLQENSVTDSDFWQLCSSSRIYICLHVRKHTHTHTHTKIRSVSRSNLAGCYPISWPDALLWFLGLSHSSPPLLSRPEALLWQQGSIYSCWTGTFLDKVLVRSLWALPWPHAAVCHVSLGHVQVWAIRFRLGFWFTVFAFAVHGMAVICSSMLSLVHWLVSVCSPLLVAFCVRILMSLYSKLHPLRKSW